MKLFITTAFLTLFTFLSSFTYSQDKFGNEWINYSQEYFKVKVHNTGIHRITKNNLDISGINLNNPNTIQLFNNGVEQPIYVHIENDDIQYIEFYGEKNNGDFDSLLYSNSLDQLNPYYSLYSDTSVYFLTKGSTPGLRYENTIANLVNTPNREETFKVEEFIPINQTWNSGKRFLISGVTFYKSFYEIGEGWGTSEFSQSNYEHTLNTNILNQEIEIEIRLIYVGSENHTPNIKINGVTKFTDNYLGEKTNTIKLTSQINSRELNISVGGSGENYIIGYIKVKYNKEFDFNNNSTYVFDLNTNNQRKFLEIENFKNENNKEVFLYDLDLKKRVKCFWSNSKVYTDVSPSVDEKTLVLVSDDETSYFTVSKMDPVHFTDYSNYNGDLLVIKNKKIQYYDNRDLIIEYAAHKASLGFNPVVIDIEEVINQFGYGINNHPQSIRNLYKFTSTNWNNLKYVFLIGKGRTYNEVRNFNTYDNIIPTFGHPASDNLFFSENGTINVPVSIGRLSVSTSQEFKNYFDKLVEMETAQNLPFNKKIIHLSGGANPNEEVYFENLMVDLEINALEKDYNVTAFSSTEEGNDQDLYDEINNGSMLMTYLGHANPMYIEYIGDSIELYNNKSKYPVFLSLSCKNGSYISEGTQMSETFTLEKDKGFVGYIGFSTDVTVFSAKLIADEFYNQLDVENLTVGDMIKNLINNLNEENDNFVLDLAMNSLLYHGDPTYKIYRDPFIEPTQTADVTTNEIISNTILSESDNIKLSIYPNPMVENLTIDFEKDEINNIEVIDLNGRSVKTFKNTINENTIFWNGSDNSGKRLNSGMYYIVFHTSNKTIKTKQIIIK